MQERYKDKFELEIADIRSLPFFDQNVEFNPPRVVVAFKQQISDADGILIVTPEYNWSIPGVLKNALDWLSRVNQVMVNKPVMTAGVSTGMMGTVRAQLHLRQVLSSPGISARVLPPGGNEVLINFAGEKFDASGRLAHEQTLAFLDEVVQKFFEWI
jgi:NAD(P)H-dependent FMN reductase